MHSILLRDPNRWPEMARRLERAGMTSHQLVATTDGSYVFRIEGDVQAEIEALIADQLVGHAGGERKSVAVAMGEEETEAGEEEIGRRATQEDHDALNKHLSKTLHAMTAKEIAQEAERHEAERARLQGDFVAHLESIDSGRRALVNRSVLADALEQIEAINSLNRECHACGRAAFTPHRPDCEFMRVRDALRKALGL